MSSSARVLLLSAGLILFIFIQGCEEGREESAPPSWMASGSLPAADPEWSEYLVQHTSGTVKRDAEIRLRFSRDVIDAQELDSDVTSALEIEPHLSGSARFRSPRELVFEPAGELESGTRYNVRFDPAAFPRLPESLEPYTFAFDVIGQSFEVRVDGVSASLDDRRLARVTGELRTADRAATKDVEAILAARYQDAPQTITWMHADDGVTHAFRVEGLERPPTPQDLVLTWSGAPIGVANDGRREIAIPVRGMFSVTGHDIAADGTYVTLRFSDTLDAGQDFRGLVQLGERAPRISTSGNTATVYPPEQLVGEQQLVVNAGVRSESGDTLGREYRSTLNFRREPPQVRFTGSGVVLPAGEHLEIPFEAINVHSVQVTAFQVFDDNIGQFLQSNTLDGDNELGRVGRHLWRRTIPLKEAVQDEWGRYALNATDLVRSNPGALFRFTLAINRGNSLLECTPEEAAVPVPPPAPVSDHEDLYHVERSSWDYAEEWYLGQNASYNWSERTNPCKDAYYRFGKNVSAERNFIGSNIGLLAKHGNDGSFLALATDLRAGTPLPGATIEVRNFQDQLLATLTTDADGLAVTKMDATPFYLVARSKDDVGYLKLNRGTALPTSHFDVGGQAVQQGVKGIIYGERGVWRPGDTLHLVFALHDPADAIPADHPVTLQLISPQGQVTQTRTNRAPLDGFYAFALATAEDAPTGNWTAKAILGDKTYTRTVKIETVMPNRLAIELDTGAESLRKSAQPSPLALSAQWLHGATAANLDADINVQYRSVPTTFTRFSDHVYDDPARSFSAEPVELWKGKLDAQGKAQVAARLDLPAQPPGTLRATFVTRVFEPGGAFSISRSSVPYYSYPAYVGVRLPKGDAARDMLLTDTEHMVSIATLDPDGEPLSVDDIEVTLYKIDWKWWWDKSADSLAKFASASHRDALQRDVISTRDGKGEWKFSVAYPQWGRYLVRACDRTGGHCTGSIFYIDWPGWAGRAREQGGPAASMLTLTPDKTRYSVGETARIELPTNASGRALLTVENGAGIIEQRWLELDAKPQADQGRRVVEIPLVRGMAPNIYVSITLVQPHANRDNDRPIRLFGIVPLLVDDPATLIQPQLDVAETWKPRTTVNVGVREAQGRAMTYTLAVVDEGLLGLTNFRVPVLHESFYSREALGVLTWDLFDQVVGAYGGDLERLLALGGSDSADAVQESNEERRFPPVVRFIGPFRLEPGTSATHAVDIPQYIGAVRVMVVAGHDGAYGADERTVTVREPVSALVTLPRVLGPGEEIDVPVSLFVYDETLHDASITLQLGDHLEAIQPLEQRVAFDGQETTTHFRLRVAEGIGKTSVTAIVRSGEHETRTTTHLEIRAASAPRLEFIERRLDPGETWEGMLELHGLDGTNSATLDLSATPPFGLEHRLDFLVRYPYGCVEQTTSAALPQVYLPKLVKLDEPRERAVQHNVESALGRLRSYQQPSGAFSYWPGSNHYSDWSDVYAGYFLVEAKRFGYQVPPDMLSRWLDHAGGLAGQWTTGGHDASLTQAFRLYVLAVANRPEIGAMNRLRESASLPRTAAWLLAAAYATTGLSEPAVDLLDGPLDIEADYGRPGDTFGSALRDRAILLQALVAAGRHEAATEVAMVIARELATDRWHSTQGTGFGLAAMGRYVVGDGKGRGVQASYTAGGDDARIETSLPMASSALPVTQDSAFAVTNHGEQPLFATLTVAGVPRPGEEEAARGELAVDAEFLDANGENIDIARLSQGTNIIARITVHNRSGHVLKHLALHHVVPSGWEIANSRMDGDVVEAGFEYRDIRDDRVYTHFGLKQNESRTFTLRFTATYAGRYFAPGIVFEDMYDHRLSARTAGRWVEVIAR